MAKKIIILLIILMAAGFVVLTFSSGHFPSSSGKLQISASVYPVAYFAQEIGGVHAEVFTITPAGAEPHDYEPSSRDIAKITDSSILFLNGSGLEAWANNVAKNLDSQNTVVVTVGGWFGTQEINEKGHAVLDPHFWLSPTLAKAMVNKMVIVFEQKDPANAAYYAANAVALKTHLDQLNGEFAAGLSHCAQKDIITSHAAFGYLASSYGLTQVPIAGLSPDTEPSSKQIAEVADFAKKNNIKYIFFESLVSPKLSQTIASEVGARTLVLNPLEGLTPKDIAAGKNYFTEMRNNLSNLQIALQCNKQ